MKTARKLIALLLVLVLCAALATPAFAAKEEKKTFNYVSFGASNTLGYGLHGFVPEEMYKDPSFCFDGTKSGGDGYFTSGYYTYSDRCYPVLIKNSLQERFGDSCEVVLKQCALNSMRAYDLMYFLDDSWPADEYVHWRLGDGSPNSGWIYDIERERNDTIVIDGKEYSYKKDATDMRAEYRAAVESADLITFEYGINDFGVYIGLNQPCDLRLILDESYSELYYSTRERLQEMLKSYLGEDYDEESLSEIERYIDRFVFALVGFVKSFDASMKTIYGMNPDVDIVVVSIQNLYAGMSVKLGDIAIPLGDMLGAGLNIVNTYMALGSPYCDRYSFADVSSENGRVHSLGDELLEWNGDPRKLSQDLKDGFDVCDTKFRSFSVVKERVDAYCKEKGIGYGSKRYLKLLDDAHNAVYCALAEAAVTGLRQNVLTVDDLNFNTQRDAIKSLAYNSAIDKVLCGGDYDMEKVLNEVREEIGTALSTDVARSDYRLYLFTGFANCFFCHPSAEGYAELHDKILRAYDEGISGRRAFIDAVNTLHRELAGDILRLGLKLPVAIIENVAEVFGLSAEDVSVLTSYISSDDFIKLLCGWIGLKDVSGLSKLLGCIERAERDTDTCACDGLVKVKASRASLFRAGNIEHYICPDCGACYSDSEGEHAIDPLSVIIPRLDFWSIFRDFIARFVNNGIFGGIRFGAY